MSSETTYVLRVMYWGNPPLDVQPRYFLDQQQMEEALSSLSAMYGEAGHGTVKEIAKRENVIIRHQSGVVFLPLANVQRIDFMTQGPWPVPDEKKDPEVDPFFRPGLFMVDGVEMTWDQVLDWGYANSSNYAKFIRMFCNYKP